MTAFASRTGSHETTAWVWEMRGVNARGLDLRLRVPEGLSDLETNLRATLGKHLKRGNVSLTLRISQAAGSAGLIIDQGQLDAVLLALDKVQDRALGMGVTLGQPTAADVLLQRGVIAQGQSDRSDEETAQLVTALKADFIVLLDAFCEMRATEGVALRSVLEGHTRQIADLTALAQDAEVARQKSIKDNLANAIRRVLDVTSEVKEPRLAQELALLAVKADITEELDRLRAHIVAANELLSSNDAQGRKLDFLTQEFNREANTLCSKAGSTELTRIGLDLKAVIDQMREQTQNVE